MYEYTKHFNRDLLANVCTSSQLKFREVFPNMIDRIGMCSPKGYGFSFWSKNGYYTMAFYCPFWFSTKPRESLSGARVAQWWEHSPPSNVARVQIPASTPYVGWAPWFVVRSPSPFVVGSLPCSERFFSGSPVFPLLKNQHFQIRSNSIWNARTHLNEFIWTLKCFVSRKAIYNFFFSFLSFPLQIDW